MDLQSLGSMKPPEPVWEADVTCRRVEEDVAYEEYPIVVGPVRLETGRRTAGERGLCLLSPSDIDSVISLLVSLRPKSVFPDREL